MLDAAMPSSLRFLRWLALAVAGVACAGAARADCADVPGPCRIDTGEYHIRLPAAQHPRAVVMLHGAGGSGAGMMGRAQVIDALIARGYAVIAPTGGRSFGDSGFSWGFLRQWTGRDETAFLKAVAEDAAARFGLDRARMVLAGFSAGGFMTTYLACETPALFSAYAPVAGGFWRPQPKHCAAPVRLFHTHGWTDRTVPLEGRPLRGGTFIQGDIWAGMELWRDTNDCDSHAPQTLGPTGDFLRRGWLDCAPGGALEFALFPGGHTIPDGWADMVLDWYEALPRP